jgi:hypothetical protein
MAVKGIERGALVHWKWNVSDSIGHKLFDLLIERIYNFIVLEILSQEGEESIAFDLVFLMA